MRRTRTLARAALVAPALVAVAWQAGGRIEAMRSGAVVEGHRAALSGPADDAVTWSIEALDTGRSASIAVSGDGTPHVAFYQGAALAVTHAAKPAGGGAGGWTMNPIGGNGSPDTGTAIGTGPDGDPRVAFGDASGRIMYGAPVGSGWEREVVENAGARGTDVALDVDVVGQAVVAYYIAVDQDLKVMAGPDDGFRQVRRISLGDVGRNGAVVAGAEGAYHAAFQDTSNRRLMYESSGREGVNETVALVQVEGQVSIDLGPSGTPHIAYATGGEIRHARRVDGTWIVETVAAAAGASSVGTIRVDEGGREHLVFHDASAGAVRYARRGGEGEGWQIDDVEAAGTAAVRTSLALDPSGNPHVVWGPAAGGPIRYAAGRLGAATPSVTPTLAPSATPIPPFRRPTATPGAGTPTAAPATNTAPPPPPTMPPPTADPGDLTERIFLPQISKDHRLRR